MLEIRISMEGRAGQHEFTVAIVFPCGKEVVKHLVLIGGANQLIDGKPHILRVKRRQNIAGNYRWEPSR